MHTISQTAKDRQNHSSFIARHANAPNTTINSKSAKLNKNASLRPKNLKDALLSDGPSAAGYIPNVIGVNASKAATVQIPPTKRQRLSLSQSKESISDGNQTGGNWS